LTRETIEELATKTLIIPEFSSTTDLIFTGFIIAVAAILTGRALFRKVK
jgi:hypothetical protein